VGETPTRSGRGAMAFADVGDVQLSYTDEGTGDPPILFIHG
jgi:pimeloyl-ACP methyl ester carboxylesterase